jgi:uncharacterized RDD family membrane protein YckC
MKCEKCACEMPGSRVICPQCGFNNAAQRADKWKAQRQGSPSTESTSAVAASAIPTETTSVASASSSAAAKVRARYASEAKLLQFPVAPKTEIEAPKETAPSEPAWRELARAKVREHQQRRQGDAHGSTPPPPIQDDPTSQLIVESALKRIRRVQPPPTVRPLPRVPRHNGGQAVARALDYDEQPLEDQTLITPAVAAPAPLATPAPHPVVTRAKSAAPSLRQATPEALRARLETIAPQSAVAAVAAATLTLAIEESIPTLQSVAAETEVEAEEVVSPALAALEQQTAETRATASKKSNVWVGKPAPIWLRALAGAVDLEAAALAYLPFFGAYTSLDGPPEWADLYLMASILAVVLFLYQLITYSFNGRTFGMALCGLRCVDVTDASTPISFNRRLWQSLGGTIGLLCPPFNFVVTRLTEYQRGLADALGKTITLRRAED